MKKFLAVLLAIAIVMVLSTAHIFAAGKIVKTVETNKEIKGQADYYGHVFEDVEPGVYKIGYYFDVENYNGGRQVRISPKVQGSSGERRCWFDFRLTPQVVEKYQDSGLDKMLMVVVINIPEGYNRIDAGLWQDNETIIGTLEKVVLATHDYNMYDNDYYLLGEMNYRGNLEGDSDHSGTTFGEDPEQKLLAPEGSWTPSGETTGDPKTETPGGTGDTSVLFALIAAGAASFGGLKLRRK